MGFFTLPLPAQSVVQASPLLIARKASMASHRHVDYLCIYIQSILDIHADKRMCISSPINNGATYKGLLHE